MDPRIKRKAEELGRLLADSEVFQKLEKARAQMQERSAAQMMLRDLQQKQQRLRQKQLEGQEITQSDIDDLRRTSQLASMNPYVRELLEAEMAFSSLWLEVEAILAKAVGIQMPDTGEEEGDEESTEAASSQREDNEAATRARSRLWVPGQ